MRIPTPTRPPQRTRGCRAEMPNFIPEGWGWLMPCVTLSGNEPLGLQRQLSHSIAYLIPLVVVCTRSQSVSQVPGMAPSHMTPGPFPCMKFSSFCQVTPPQSFSPVTIPSSYSLTDKAHFRSASHPLPVSVSIFCPETDCLSPLSLKVTQSACNTSCWALSWPV